jgi:predicted Zn-dependent protease
MKLAKFVSLGSVAFALASIGLANLGNTPIAPGLEVPNFAFLQASKSPVIDAKTFTQADLEKMVTELMPAYAKDPRLTYPIRCVVDDVDDVNAYANAYFDPNDKKKQPQAQMTVHRKLITFLGGEIRLLRAVVSHEIAHLSKGHLGKNMSSKDADLIFIRQQEYEADVVGAAALEQFGYSKKDMIDMLQKLGAESRNAPDARNLMGDHADCDRRALNVDKSNIVLRSMVSFTNGEAYFDVRSYLPAMQEFDKAAEKAPTFYEARYNSALAATVYYWDKVADAVRGGWYIPDFGPSLIRAGTGGKATIIVDEDRKNFRQATDKLATLIALDPKRQETLELQGLLLVLEPDGNATSITAGTKILESALKSAVIPGSQLRIANNLAIGYQRAGNVGKAVDVMLAEQNKTTKFNTFLAANLGQQDLPESAAASASKAEAVLYTFLSRSSSAVMGYSKALSTYNKLCAKYKLKPREIKEKGISLCRAFGVVIDGKTISLLSDASESVVAFGAPEKGGFFDENYKGFKQFEWKDGKLNIIVEKGPADTLDILRVTSYYPGSYVELKPLDTRISGSFKIFVGMTKAQFGEILNVDGGVSRNLIRLSEVEDWLYYPGLLMGVLIKDNKVVGVTSTPAAINDIAK